MLVTILIVFFQNCSNQKGLDLLVLPGSGISVSIESLTPEVLDENIDLIPVNIEFGAIIEKLDPSKLQVENAVIESIQGVDQHYTLNLIPSAPGEIKLFLPEKSCQKINSNVMCAASNYFVRNLSSAAPQIKLTPISNRASVADSFKLNIDLTKPYMLKDLAQFKTQNATLENLNLRDGSTCLCEYEVTVVPNGELGQVISVQFPENIFYNKWKVGNSASNEYQVLFAATPPEIILSSSAPSEVLGTFDVQLISSVPILNATSITADSFTVLGADIYSVENILDTKGNHDPFRLLIRVRPNADNISIQARENIIVNRFHQGNTVSNSVQRTYSNGRFMVTYPQPALPITPQNIHAYNIKGNCPYNDRKVEVFIDKPIKQSLGQVNCTHSTDLTTGVFDINLDFGTRSVGLYVLTLETSDPSGIPISLIFNVEMASVLNISTDTTPNPLLFEDVVSDAVNTRVYSNILYVTGIDAPTGISFTGDPNAFGTPKVKIVRNNQAVSTETTVASIQNGDLISLSTTVPPYHGMSYDIVVNIGPSTTHWKVSHIDSDSFAVVFTTQESDNPGYYGGSAVKADDFCNSKATMQGFGGTWKAMLTDNVTPLPNKIPWAWKTLRRLDGAIVANNWKNLWQGSERLLAPLNINQYGDIVSGGNGRAFTGVSSGSGSPGYLATHTCGTSDSAPFSKETNSTASAGFISATNQSWLFGNPIDCYGRASLYCISDTSSALDETPSLVEFLKSVSYIPDQKVTSNGVRITGINRPINIHVEDPNSTARLTINGGPEVLSGKVTIGDIIRVSNRSPSVKGQVIITKVFLGNIERQWQLGTADQSKSARVFISSQAFGASLGGLTGADEKCRTLATQAGYGGTWKAMLSDSNNNMRDRIPWNWGKLVLVDNTTVVADQWETLWNSNLKASVSLNEKQLQGPTAGHVFSGTKSNGAKTFKWSNTQGETYCSDWSSNGTGIYTILGATFQTGSSWLNSVNSYCYSAQYLYCIEDQPAGEDQTPNDFLFPYKTFQAINTRISSDTVTITGISTAVSVSLTGSQGAPSFKIQRTDGSWTGEVTSETINSGDKIILSMASPGSLNTSNKVILNVGTKSVPWRIWTGDANTGVTKIIFVSSGTYTGMYEGLSGFDSKCQTLGQTINTKRGTNSTWKALISGDIEGSWAINRMNYNWSGLKTVNTNGSDKDTVFTGSQIWDGTGPSAFLDTDENGNPVSSTTAIWTNTQSNGLAASTTETCSNFAGGASVNYTPASIGLVGGGVTTWINTGKLSCWQYAHIICVEQ